MVLMAPSLIMTIGPVSTSNDNIDAPYLLVLFSVVTYIDPAGRRYLDRLWAKDVLEHLRYLPQLTICCYELPKTQQAVDLVCIDDDLRFIRLRTVGVPKPTSMFDAIRRIPRTVAVLWSELGRCQVLHSGVGGWPLPEPWFLMPMLRLRPRPYVIIVESAFWRLPAQDPAASFVRRLWSKFQERLARACLDRVDLAIFTHEGYRQTLLTDPVRGHIIEASWLDREGIIDPAVLSDRQQKKAVVPGLRVAFFGRLTREKGVLDALEAAARIRLAHVDFRLDIYGEGPLREAVGALCNETAGQVRLHSPVPYGPEFFSCLGQYDAIVVPTHSDEQPRIVFDAFSQGVPVIVSDTPGHRQCVVDGTTGAFFRAQNIDALVHALTTILQDKRQWLALGPNARHFASQHTHQAMHDRRRELLAPLLNRQCQP